MRLISILTPVLLLCASVATAQSLQRGIGHKSSNESQRSTAVLPSLLPSAGDQLIESDGTLSWKVLGRINIVRHENTDNRFGRGVAYFAEPVVSPEVKAMAGKRVKIKGYVLPRGPVDNGDRILVSALPAADEDGCTNGGGETFVDVVLPAGTAPKLDTLIVVEGTLGLFDINRWGGYIYRLSEPRIVAEA